MYRKHRIALGLSVLLLALAALAVSAAPVAACGGGVICVDADATGAATGLSWTDAFTSVQDALAVTNANGGLTYEIWVATGVYTPGNARTDAFRIAWNNVQLYGGFAGDESARDARDPDAHPTILSGDIDGNDTNTDGNDIAETWNDIQGANAYHVLWLDGVTHEPITATTVIDGFIITAGQANSVNSPHGSGAGLYCAGNGAGKACSPSLTHVTFSGNQAGVEGGGMYNNGNSGVSSPSLINVTFSGNQASIGGGMYNYGNSGVSSPSLTHVTFSGNQAGDGGGMYNYGNYGFSSPSLTHVTFSGNQADWAGGGMYNDGYNGVSGPSLINVTFSGNQAGDGGAIYFLGEGGDISATIINGLFHANGNNHIGYEDGDAGTQPQFINCTFSGALSEAIYIAVWDSGQTIDFTNSIFWGNNGNITNNDAALNVTYSIVEEAAYATGTGNIYADPYFVDADGGDLRLQPTSPAIDAGDNSAVTVLTDLDGAPRIQGSAVDMGAYEWRLLYVDADATGAATGLSWTDAYTNVQDALAVTNANGGLTYEIWVATGVYTPGNARTDSFRIARNNVQLYGGFAGDESARDARDPDAHPTILSGDIDGNDTNTDGNDIAETWADIQGANAYHVLWLDGVTHEPITETTVIDGFIITAGQANDGSAPHNSGAGLYCAGNGSGNACSPSLTHVTFSGNQASYGGGMVNDGRSGGVSSPSLTHVTFSGNQAATWGGGMYNQGNSGVSSPSLTDVTFSGNQAGIGGGMFNDGRSGGVSSPSLTRVTFSDNQAAINGGGMFNQGNSGVSSPSLTDVTFSGNQARYGGGMYNNGNSGVSSPSLTDVTFSGNQADVYGGAIYFLGDGGDISATIINGLFHANGDNHIGYEAGNAGTQPQFINCTFSGADSEVIFIDYSGSGQTIDFTNSIFWGNQGNLTNDDAALNITYSIVEEAAYATGTGNIYADPHFVDAAGGDLRLQPTSPAIDAGNPDPATCPATDLRGLPRADLRCDIGAFELQHADSDTVSKSGFTGGTPTSFGPTWVSMTLAAADTGSVTVTKHLTAPGGIWNEGEITVTWWIFHNLSAGLPVTVSFCYTDTEIGAADELWLRPFRWNDSDWVEFAGSVIVDPVHHCVTAQSVSEFSPWTLFVTGGTPEKPTAARVVAVAARGVIPLLAGLLLLGGATALRRNKEEL